MLENWQEEAGTNAIKIKRNSVYSDLQKYMERPIVSKNIQGVPKGFVKLSKKNSGSVGDKSKESVDEYDEVPKDLVGKKVNQENLDDILFKDKEVAKYTFFSKLLQ